MGWPIRARCALTLDAWQTYERLGSPEGELALAEAVVYLPVAAKSNAVYIALAEARADVEKYGSLEVPLRFRNAPTRLMKELGYGSGYRYAHDEPDAYAAGERYFPDDMPDRRYYHPTPADSRQRIGEALERLRARERPSKGRDNMIDPKLLRSDPEGRAQPRSARLHARCRSSAAARGAAAPWQIETRSAARRAQCTRQGGGQARGRGEDSRRCWPTARA